MAPVSLGSNIASLTAQRRLAEGTSSLSKTFERLSSGQRINRASDDAAGLAIVSSLSTGRRVLTQGIRNLNDGISLLNVADGAIEQLSSIVIRLKELAEQSANGTYGVNQRKAIDGEAQALSKEFFRISRSTTFNGQGLFDGSIANGLRIQAGYGTDGGIQSTLGRGLGTGSFGDRTTYSTDPGDTNSGSTAVALGDLNGDGILDIVTAGFTNNGSAIHGYATVQLGRADGTFSAKATYATDAGSGFFNGSNAISLGDLNGDGILDLVTGGYATDGSTQGQASVLLGRGDGTFGVNTTYATETESGTSASHAVSLGDLNGDGILDLVTAGYVNNGSAQGQASILLGRGDGTFGTKFTYATDIGSGSGISRAVSLGDLNGDGILDLVTAGNTNGASTQGQASVLLGRGDGTFGTRTTFATNTGSTGGNSNAISLGDLNGDGKLDLVTAGVANNGSGYQGEVSVLLGRGDGTFSTKITYATNAGSSFGGSRALNLGDLNGDGILDLVTAGFVNNGTTQGQASVLLGGGDGTFVSKTTYATDTGSGPSSSNAVSLGDLNGDGILDLVTAGYAIQGSPQGQVSVLGAQARDGISPLLSFSLKSRADSLQALSIFDHALTNISNQRGVIGAFQSRIAVATNVLQASTENYAAAAGRIQDADVAQESAQLVRTQILQQAASSVLAQANQQPALALQLLG